MKEVRATLVRSSSAHKHRGMAVSYSDKGTCPPECPLMGDGGCYATYGPASWQWAKLTRGEIGKPWSKFCYDVATLKIGSPFRHNIVGDLPGHRGVIDGGKLRQLVMACVERKLNAYTFTHYSPKHPGNMAIIGLCNGIGHFTVNLSANNLAHADWLKSLGIGPVCVITTGMPEKSYTPAGNKVITCPQVTRPSRVSSCKSCMLCAWAQRDVIIGFPVHGTKRKAAREVALG